MRKISANNTEFLAPDVDAAEFSGTYDRHDARNTPRVLSDTAGQLSELANLLRDLVRDHAKEYVSRARFRDGAEYHRQLIRAAPALPRSSLPPRVSRDAACRPFEPAGGYELWLLSWLPGQITPIHDHGGALTVTTVLSGAVLEERFEHLRGDRVRPTWTTLREVGDLDPIEPAVIHRVRPVGSAVTLHLYMPACVEGRTYEAVELDALPASA